MKTISIPSENNVLQEATKKLNEILEAQKDTPVLLLLSGGSALQLIGGIEAKHLTRDITVTVLDERYSSDEKVNNFAQIAHTDFYEMLMRHGAHVIDTRIHQNESLDDLAQRWEDELRRWVEENEKGKIVATMGIGEDAHVAGIMPYSQEVHEFQKMFENKKWVCGYDAGDKNPHPFRITTTLTFLKKIDHAVMYVVGGKKKNVIDNVLREEGNMHEYPARIIHEMKDVYLFTDQA